MNSTDHNIQHQKFFFFFFFKHSFAAEIMPSLKILPSKEIKKGTKRCKDDQLGKTHKDKGLTKEV